MNSIAQIDIQGHRGCRGLLPENSIPAFLEAVRLGVNTLEMDVVISGDGKVIVSHEAYMSSSICLNGDGEALKGDKESSLNLYKMSTDEIRKYDCGLKGNSHFPQQKKISVYKPLLSEVIDSVENYLVEVNQHPVNYNIEIKSAPEGDGIFHPEPDVFVEVLIKVLSEKNILARCVIQSFDVRPLQYLNINYPSVKIALLIEHHGKAEEKIDALGFDPDIYSPYYRLVNKKMVTRLHQRNIKIIPWTVNSVHVMKKLIDMGVDGIITDYPDVLINLVKDQRQ